MNEKPTSKNGFDLSSLRMPTEYADVAKPMFATLKIGKPSKQIFFRTFLIPDPHETYSILEAQTGDTYLFTPTLAAELGPVLDLVALVPYISRDQLLGIWPVKQTREGAQVNSWNASAWDIVTAARDSWVRYMSVAQEQRYKAVVAVGEIPDPILPPDTYEEIVRKAFIDHLVEHTDHPIVQELLGAY